MMKLFIVCGDISVLFCLEWLKFGKLIVIRWVVVVSCD